MARGTGSSEPILRTTTPRHVRPDTPEEMLSGLWLLAMIAPEPLVSELLASARRVAAGLGRETVELCFASAQERADVWWEQIANGSTRVVVGS